MLAASSSEFQSWEHKYDVPYDCPNCNTAWGSKPETWACSETGCETGSCPDCKTACFSCDRAYCKAHLIDTEDGPCCATCADEIDDPQCECVRIDVDQDDASDCPLHGPHGPLAKSARKQEAEDEARVAARLSYLLGLTDEEMKDPF
jgi:hypothetical protein